MPTRSSSSSGARAERWLEAIDLLKAGDAPRIVLSQGAVQDGEEYLATRGITHAD